MLISVAILSGGCEISREASLLKDIYRPIEESPEVYVSILDTGVNESIVYVGINTESLQYMKTLEDTIPSCRILLRIICENLDQNILEDSTSLSVKAYKRNGKQLLIIPVKVSLRDGFNYRVYTEVTDILRGSIQKALAYHRRDPSTSDIFIFIDFLKTPLFGNWIYRGKPIYVSGKKGKVCVAYLGDTFRIPPPPFVRETQAEESSPHSWKEVADSCVIETSSPVQITLEKEGLYVISGENKNDRKFLLVVSDGFPYPIEWNQIIPPLRYVTTKKEFENIITSPSPSREFEKFFLDITGGDKETARKIIRWFYSRVAYANYQFTMCSPGALSDRGMIYIVFGPPSLVQKNDTMEKWFYGSEDNPFHLSFTFIKRRARSGCQDFVLERDEGYKFPWYRSVDIVRAGLLTGHRFAP